MFHWWILPASAVLCFIFVDCSDDPIVELPYGKIRGRIFYTSRNNVKFWAFQGIPYAAPPTGKNRFQPPQPVKSWSGTLDTRSRKTTCFQTTSDHAGDSEDCLHLQVYTPKEPGTNATLPVMLNIHGGTFRNGASVAGNVAPQVLLEHEVVIVTINYRLGPFGFLSTQDSVIPGNNGLKDQQCAMKWTRENVHLFGGDPTKITIMGQSAGSASVTYQMLSSSSSGLFRAAIGQSGSALNTWAFQPEPVDIAYGIAALIDPAFTKNNSTQELLDLLQSVDAKAIHATNSVYRTFAPVIEIEHEGAMITESMYQAAANGRFNKVPYLAGICSEEGIIEAASMDAWKKILKTYDNDIRKIVDDDMYIDDDHIKVEVGNKIKQIYTNNTFSENIGASIQMQGDNRYMRAPIKFSELVSEYTDVYFYQFSYHGELGGNKHLIDGIGKVGHGEDLNYLWPPTATLNKYPERDTKTVDRYVGLLTNFAKYLNPLPKKLELFQNLSLPKVTKNRFYYLDIDENLSIEEKPRNLSYQKWVDIYEEYAKKPLISF